MNTYQKRALESVVADLRYATDERIKALRAERDALRAQLRAAPERVIVRHNGGMRIV